MISRDNLLRYARYLSDDRVGRCAGYCHSHMVHQKKGDRITPTPCTILAELLPDLPDDLIQTMTSIAHGSLTMSPEAQACVAIIPKLAEENAGMVLNAARSLYDLQSVGASTGEERAE